MFTIIPDPNALSITTVGICRNQRRRQMLQHLESGSQVIVHGRIAFYEQRGRLQIVADFVEPEGLGLRQAQFNRLRLQLEEEGLFDLARKRRLPVV